MSNKITPDESRVVERGAYIQTRCPKDDITDEAIATRARADNLGVGDQIVVQCTTHDRTTVLHHRTYLVYSRRSQMKTIEQTDRDIRQFEEITYGVEPLTDWIATRAGKAEEDALAGEKKAKAQKAA